MSQPQSNPDGAWTATIANNLAGLKQGLDALGRWLKNHAVGRETDDRAHLVFEEIVNNIIRHGFEDNREHPIRVGARMDGEELTLTFDDEGRPFDPSSAPEFRRADMLERAPIGGRGLLLVRRAARRMDYARTEKGHNLLSVTLVRG